MIGRDHEVNGILGIQHKTNDVQLVPQQHALVRHAAMLPATKATKTFWNRTILYLRTNQTSKGMLEKYLLPIVELRLWENMVAELFNCVIYTVCKLTNLINSWDEVNDSIFPFHTKNSIGRALNLQLSNVKMYMQLRLQKLQTDPKLQHCVSVAFACH